MPTIWISLTHSSQSPQWMSIPGPFLHHVGVRCTPLFHCSEKEKRKQSGDPFRRVWFGSDKHSSRRFASFPCDVGLGPWRGGIALLIAGLEMQQLLRTFRFRSGAVESKTRPFVPSFAHYWHQLANYWWIHYSAIHDARVLS